MVALDRYKGLSAGVGWTPARKERTNTRHLDRFMFVGMGPGKC